jgi:hypothetical protein
MDAYFLIGNPNTRKSSVVRSLTGCFNRSIRDIQLLSGPPPLRIYARVGSLQDSRATAAEFEQEAARKRCGAVLCCLGASASPLDPELFPDAASYLAHFAAAGWRIKSIAVLGQNGGGVRAPVLRQFPQAPADPINVTAQGVRAHFGWF